MRTYYNDTDPFVCDWLLELMKDGYISEGDVDRRSITEVEPSDLKGYTRCHFFAGIGGWDLALQMAGWSEDREVWTGSCPCQPFSSAGSNRGTEDERHLWPTFSELIAECCPPTVFGEQVASKAGRSWLAGVFADLETMGYRRSGADLCGAGVGSPHIRQRLFWLADTNSGGCFQSKADHSEPEEGTPERNALESLPGGRSGVCNGVGNAHLQRPQGHWGSIELNGSERWQPKDGHRSSTGLVRCVEPRRGGTTTVRHRRVPTEPTLYPMAYGVPNRVGILRGAGNAIVPQVAAEFISAYLELN